MSQPVLHVEPEDDPAVESREWNDPGRQATDHLDRSPARVSATIAIGSAILALLFLPSVVSVWVGVPGSALLGYGAVRGSRRRVTGGCLVLVVAVVLAGLQGAGAVAVLPATFLVVLAWDVGRFGITIGEQLGREADTTSLELAHVAMTTAIGGAGAGMAYAVYLVATGGQPVVVLALLLLGGVVILATLE